MSKHATQASLKDLLPEWDDSESEWELTQQELKRHPEYISTPLGRATTRNTTPREVKVHPFPTTSENKFKHHPPHHVSSGTKSSPRNSNKESSNNNNTQSQFKSSSIPQNHAYNYKYRGDAHNNEIMMYREKTLQAVDSVQCIVESLDDVRQYIENERSIDEKNLMRLLYPVKNHFGSYTKINNNPAIPSEVLILSQKLSTLQESFTNLLTVFVDCVSSRSKIYVKQIQRMREVSNVACRNALQAERAEFSSQIIHLRKEHIHAMEALSEEKLQTLEEKEKLIQVLAGKVTELECQRSMFDEREQAMEKLRVELQDRVDAAVATALRDAQSSFDNQQEELRSEYEAKLQNQGSLYEKWQQDVENNFNEKMSVQSAHHEQLYNLLSEEKERISQENMTLRGELQVQAKKYAEEKAQLLEECSAEQRKCEAESDARVAEQIKVVSTLKAEMAAKVRIVQEKEKTYIEELYTQRMKEKEEMESNMSEEMDNMAAQHRRALQHLRAQLDVKHSDDLARQKRNHENEVRRLILETERLRKLVIRRGIGAGQDGIELDMEDPPLSSNIFTPQDTNERLASSFNEFLTQQDHLRAPKSHQSPTSHAGTSQLNWGALRESLNNQQKELSHDEISPIPKDNTSYQSILETSPSGRLRFPIPEKRDSKPPPPPPPDTYLVDEAYEASREKGSSVSNNATNVGKYMSQLQKYLEGDGGIEDATFNTQSTGDESSTVDNARSFRYKNLYESSQSGDSDDVDSLCQD